MKNILSILSFSLITLYGLTAEAQQLMQFEMPWGTDSAEVTMTEENREFGKVIAVYPGTEQRAYVANYRNGKLNGMVIAYYPDGTYRYTQVWGNGVIHGDVAYYNPEGTIMEKGKYRLGLRHGYWAQKWEGCMGRYKKDQRHGKWKCFSADGFLDKIQTYHKGELLKEVSMR